MPTTIEEVEKDETSEEKKDKLLLDSLEIKGYRCFEHLTIEKLGRVNLIVGKNTVGKTALLESLCIWAQGTSWTNLISSMDRMLSHRNEKVLGQMFEKGAEFRHLYFGRPLEGASEFRITNQRELTTRLRPSIRPPGEDFVGARIEFTNGRADLSQLIQNHGSADFHQDFKNLFVASGGLRKEFLNQIWDELILKNREDEVVESLRIITPEIIDVNLIVYPKGAENRVPVVRIEGVDERIPLDSLGEGMRRLLGLALALTQCKNGLLLVDEVEIGLHYSVLPDVWKLIFKTAQDLNVQVFATTHSKDCIEAFAQAAYDSPEQGNLIRLERHGEKIVAKTIEEEMLVDAVNYDVEVR